MPWFLFNQITAGPPWPQTKLFWFSYMCDISPGEFSPVGQVGFPSIAVKCYNGDSEVYKSPPQDESRTPFPVDEL